MNGAIRLLVVTILLTVILALTGAVSAGKKPPADGDKIIGAWKATVTDKEGRAEFGVFTFSGGGRFTLEREHFLDLVKGTYAVEGAALKITATDAVDGAPMVKGKWPVTTKSLSDKEIVLELKQRGETVLIHLARLPLPEGAWQAIEQDRKKLQGTWEYVATEQDGMVVKDKDAAKSFTFENDKIREPGTDEYGTFTLSANRKLKAIQFRFTNGKGLANIFAYELDGDTLRLCRNPDRVFPEEFRTKGTKNRIEEFKRVKH